MHQDSHYMEIAYKEALKGALIDEVPVGAIIVKDNKIIARAHNLKETKNIAINHAEIIAITKANKKLKTWHLDGTTMYVTLEPCMMCVGAIIQSRIERVVYGAKSFQDGALESTIKLNEIKGLNHYPLITYLEGNNKCSKIISDYFKRKR